MEQTSNNKWDVFHDLNISQDESTWDVFDELQINYEKLINYKRDEYLKLIKKWDSKLEFLGKDSTHINWDNFRPLRLSREEDWSDWLAFLIERSNTGFFAENIFNITSFKQDDYILPIKVLREENDYLGSFRADIIIQWKNKKYTHFEIKVGDPNLFKTFVASQNFRRTYKVNNDDWSDYILLLPNQVSDWENALKLNNTDSKIVSITWKDIAIILRKSLFTDESISWKVWAYSFTGVIEQKLLGLNNYWDLKDIPYTINDKIEILENAMKNE